MTDENIKANITFELENKEATSVKIMRHGKTIGRLWSQLSDGTLPYPHRKNIENVQLCGFDKMSEVWQCGPFSGHKDCVVTFLDTDSDTFRQRQVEGYKNYVNKFFTVESKVIPELDNRTVHHTKPCKDLLKLKSFVEWQAHNLD
jgi:hypothetical protein